MNATGITDSDRYWIVVIREPDGSLNALSRRAPDADGTPFAGPWKLLAEDEAEELAAAYNDDPREGGTAEAVEVYRFDGDPGWPAEAEDALT